ncbi:putative DNA binding domain-containing protein [Cellulomonas sp. DKR-3]|uniref:DNA binding domain-containing protein n=1 Tax=Cellulomonas fulva TaxID=2835530 RepID=A0ABS5U292_9CELL|nr:ATP-binding protein [Cellulomonas fulva]MBT0995495.1 putative DNA binding domain-containing protein [Cellulomonas fulva]
MAATDWTPIHVALGEPRSALTFELVERAVAAQVPESDTLDWKAQVRTDEVAKQELAKDLAALANTAGGILVIGVGEEGRGTDKRFVMQPFPLMEQVEQQVRSVNVSRVRPVIQGLDVRLLPMDDKSGNGVVVVTVPPSPDAPHFVERRESTVAPWRNGSHTDVLPERQIERAYADRFARRATASANLKHLADSTRELLSHDKVWVVGVAQPRVDRGVTLNVPSRDDATTAVLDSLQLARDTVVHGAETDAPRAIQPPRSYSTPFSTIGDAMRNPRRGLRRWVIRPDSTELSRTGVATTTYAELHESGAVVLAEPCRVSSDLRDANRDDSLVHAATIENNAVATVALAAAWAARAGAVGTYALRVDVLPRKRDRTSLLRVVSNHAYGQGFVIPEVPEWTTGRTRLVPAEGELLDPQDPGDRQLIARQLAEDLEHQFGLTTLELLR